MKFGRYIHDDQGMNPTDFSGPLTLILGLPFVIFLLPAWTHTLKVFLHSWSSESSKLAEQQYPQ